MVEGGKDFRLTLEAPQALIVGGKLVRQDLDGDISAELPVSCPIHLTHAAFSNGLDDLVVSQLVTGCERHDRGEILRRYGSKGNRVMGAFGCHPALRCARAACQRSQSD